MNWSRSNFLETTAPEVQGNLPSSQEYQRVSSGGNTKVPIMAYRFTLDTSRLCEAKPLVELVAARFAGWVKVEQVRLAGLLFVKARLEETFCWETSASVYKLPYIRALLFRGCLSTQDRSAEAALRSIVITFLPG